MRELSRGSSRRSLGAGRPSAAAVAAAWAAFLVWSGALYAEPKQPHLLLVTVDTLRADALGCYGNERTPTPRLDALAEAGVLFEDTITTIGKTGPAIASLFTSAYPPTHGARRNGVPMRPDIPTLAEQLESAGYRTAGFVSNWTLRSRLAAVDRGFQHWDEEFDRKRNPFGASERTAAGVTRAALAWLDSQPRDEGPFFVWVHFSEPHDPYERHDGFEARAPRERSDGWQKRWRYASEVAYVDHAIGRLLDGLEQRMPAAERLTVFVADHGESLGEHGYWGHGKNTYWPNLRIPLIVRGPGVPHGRRSTVAASIVDVLPTVADLLGLPVPKGAAGMSLRTAWQGQAPRDRPRFAFADRHTAIGSSGRTVYEHPLEIALQVARVKAVYDFDRQRPLFFDLEADPREHRPLEASPVDFQPPLYRRLASWYRELPKYEGRSGGELSAEDIEQLRALGYVDDVRAREGSASNDADPEDE
jgi:arylsulfatase A-like enzyme